MGAPKLSEWRALKEKFSDMNFLKQISLDYLREIGPKGAPSHYVDFHVALTIAEKEELLDFIKEDSWIREQFSVARDELKKEDLIGFNTRDEVWYIKKIAKKLTPKEMIYLKAQGLGPGWKNIPSKTYAIEWIYKNLSALEFEHFCISILNSHCQVSVRITEKRPKSGADGGLDGIGEIELEGIVCPFGLQVKKHAPHSQIGEDQCERFIGALQRRRWKHGFIITTGAFSQKSYVCIEDFKAQDIFIELIDKDFLTEIMLKQTTKPHGFGLHQTEIGRFYMNEVILKQAARIAKLSS
jgi:hypothetical protein